MTSELVELTDNTSFGVNNMPDRLRLSVPVPNSTGEEQMFQYSCKEKIVHQQIEEKEFEEKVTARNNRTRRWKS